MSIKKFTVLLSTALLYLSVLNSCEGNTDIEGAINANNVSSGTVISETELTAETSDTPEITAEQPAEISDPETEELGFSAAANGYDVDLTVLNGTMVYAQVYDMISHPEEYNGKTVRVHGPFAYYTAPDTGKEYFSVLIKDASACCAQGIEFVTADEHKYPDDYPEINTEITVSGICDIYVEDGYQYCQLLDAVMTTE